MQLMEQELKSHPSLEPQRRLETGEASSLNRYVRRAAIGTAAGLIASIALVATQPNRPLAILLALALGALYGMVVRPAPLAYADSLFTAAALAVAVWGVMSVIVLPALAGEPPRWDVEGVRAVFPEFAGWILYGAILGLTTQAFADGVNRVMGPEALPRKPSAAQATSIVILGGGFAGMTTAENLEREFGADPSVTFTLVSDANALLFTPMLAEVAGSSLEPSHISTPLRTSLHRTAVVRGHVTHVDLETRCVRAASPHGGEDQEIPFHHLVFALGSVSNYFGNENIRNCSFDFKSLLDAIRIRNHVIDMFECADRETDPAIKKEFLTIVIAGGGFAGVELAGALNDFARGILADYPHLRSEDVNVTLVHARDLILPELSPTLGEYARRSMEARGVHFELGRRVMDARPGAVMLDNREIAPRLACRL